MIPATQLLALLLVTAAPQPPSEPTVHAYAIVVGSRAGGPGQAPLRYATEDATRMSRLLQELGRYPREQVRLLLDPTRQQLDSELGRARERLAAHRSRGEQASFLFYYSGHARANALNLGAEEFPLSALREQLVFAPSTLTLAILDACQSGALSRIKGAEPTADFSINSRAYLGTRGLAVLTSSTAHESSQESDALRGSFFTHNLVTGLRGAADVDADGRVTLSEAYRYAYGRTLVQTSATAVGSQHATLETDLKGKGEVPLTYPKEASASLVLPGALEGNLVISLGESILAEVHKVRGTPMRLGLPPGRYSVFIRQDVGRSCTVELDEEGETTLEASRCSEVALAREGRKGISARPHRWGFELSLGLGMNRDDWFIRSWVGGHPFQFRSPWRYRLAVSRDLTEHLTLLLGAEYLERRTFWTNDTIESSSLRVGWDSYGAGMHLRANFRLLSDRLVTYLQVGGGLGWSHLEIVNGDIPHRVVDRGFFLGAAVGIQAMLHPHFGLFLEANHQFAPITRTINDVGGTSMEPHDSGGPSGRLGVRIQL